MRPSNPYLAATLAAFMVAATVDLPDSTARSAGPAVAPLARAELAAVRGGVFGGRIGQDNKGILELSCGAEDLWPATGNLWETASGTAVSDCDPFARPHYLPRYNSAADVVVYVGGVVTKLSGTGGTPRIRVFVNGKAGAVATVPCTLRNDYPSGTALGINGNPNRGVEAWACPDNGSGNNYGVPISLASAGLHPGLNAVRAVTEGAVGIDDSAQDQEVRFFCIGTGSCLPARVELRPVANGSLNQFEFPSGVATHWTIVNDYPDTGIPDPNTTADCTPTVPDAIAHTSQTVETELFQMGGSVPPGLTFSSCTLKAHMQNAGDPDVCSATSTYLVVRNSAGTQSDGPVLHPYHFTLPVEQTRVMPINPFTAAAWTSADLTNLQAGVKDDSVGAAGMIITDLLMECTF